MAIIGSPHKSNSYRITRQVEERMKRLDDVGLDYLFLKDADLQPRRGCFSCILKGDHLCPLRDDRDQILEGC